MGMINDLAIGIGSPVPTRTIINEYGIETSLRIWYNQHGQEITDAARIEEIKQQADRVSAVVEYDHALSLHGTQRMVVKNLLR